MRKFLNIAEPIMTVLLLLFYAANPLVLILSGGRSEGQQGLELDFALVRNVFSVIYIATILLLAPYWKRALYILFKEKIVLLLIIVASVSVLWSDAPELTINRSVALAGTTLFGLYLATRYSLKRQLQLLGWAFGLILVLSVLFAIALPQYGVMAGTHAGAWRGIYYHKNGFGSGMVLSAVIFLLLALDARQNKWVPWSGFGLSLMLLLLARSTSPLIHLVILLGVFAIVRSLRLRYTLRTFVLSLIGIIGLGVISVLASQASAIVGIFGKDLTFTGRSNIWRYVWELIWQSPWIGYGYGSLWANWGSKTADVWYATAWEAPSAHNGFLDLWLGVGLLGISIFALHFLLLLAKSLSLISRSSTAEYFFPLIVLLITVLSNLTETTLLDRNSIHWLLYSAVSFSFAVKPLAKAQVFRSMQALKPMAG